MDQKQDQAAPMPSEMTDAQKIKSLADSLRWAAQTIHQANHFEAEESKTWRECPRGFCGSIRHELEKAGQEI